MDSSGADKMAVVDVVVKIGGGVLAHPDHFEAALAAIGAAGRTQRLLVVPGGGPFADTIREVAGRIRLSDDAAHWMALLAMDQYAHLVAERLADSVLVTKRHEMAAALDAPVRLVPVLAPFRWLHEADPLPHSWDVTSDSIAAWVAGQVGARQLILVKPPGATDAANCERVDPYFTRALLTHVRPIIISADQIGALRAALQERSA